MRALLLAAGHGTRLRPLTDTMPKCLVPIHHVPLLNYWLDLLLTGEMIERVLINTHYRAEQVKAHVLSSRWFDRVDLVYEPELLGTAGTLLANSDYFGREPVLVAHADNLTRFELRAFIARHHSRPRFCEITMMTFETDTPKLCGIIEQDDQGVVRAFHEKSENPPEGPANAAVYIFEPNILKNTNLLRSAPYDISIDILPNFLGKIVTYHNNNYHRDIGNAESLTRAHAELRYPFINLV